MNSYYMLNVLPSLNKVLLLLLLCILLIKSDLKWCIHLSRSKIEVPRDVRNSKSDFNFFYLLFSLQYIFVYVKI